LRSLCQCLLIRIGNGVQLFREPQAVLFEPVVEVTIDLRHEVDGFAVAQICTQIDEEGDVFIGHERGIGGGIRRDELLDCGLRLLVEHGDVAQHGSSFATTEARFDTIRHLEGP